MHLFLNEARSLQYLYLSFRPLTLVPEAREVLVALYAHAAADKAGHSEKTATQQHDAAWFGNRSGIDEGEI